MTDKAPRKKARGDRSLSGSSGIYEVGYGRTPIQTRFQPGQSGNPRGRPKGQKSIGKLLAEALSRRIKVQDKGGRQKTLRVQDIIVQGLVNDAARRETSALKLLFMLMDRYADGRDNEIDAVVLQPDDLAIIDTFVASAKAKEVRTTHKDVGSEGPDAPIPPDAEKSPDGAGGGD